MPILTVAELKTYPEYDSTILDATYEIYIDRAEEKYLEIRNLPFKRVIATADGTSVLTDVDVTEIEDNYQVPVINSGEYISDNIDGSTVHNEIIKYDDTDNEVDLTANSPGSDTDIELTIYPPGSKSVVAKMVQYFTYQQSENPLYKSESLEKHSWAKWGNSDSEIISGIPKSIVGGIKRYMSFKGGEIEC